MREHQIGSFAGLALTAQTIVLAGTILLWAALSSVAILFLDIAPVPAVLGGLAGAILHWLSVVVHNLGHAWVARRVGYPMTGIRLGNLSLLGTCLYPAGEEALPVRIHVFRALGGPVASILLGLLSGAIALALGPDRGLAWWLSLFFAADNLFLLGFGAFLPLGFNDGSTLLSLRGKRGMLVRF